MMLRFVSIALALLVPLSFGVVFAQTAPGQTATTQPDAALESFAPEVRDLLKDFGNLHASLQAQRGYTEDEQPVLERFRDRVAAYNETNPGNEHTLAVELQVCMWLKDHDRVHALYERLFEATDHDAAVGEGWATYFERENEPDRVQAIYEYLTEADPENVPLQIKIAENLKQKNRFTEALDILQGLDIDFGQHPEAAILLSDCYFAEHQFTEAVEALNAIPDDVLANRAAIGRQVEQLRPDRENYIELWSKEQALREAAENEPQVQLVTDKGVIVVQLFEDAAPNTVANFISLVEEGFYNGTKFHRVIPNFMAQGGDPNSKDDVEGVPGQGGPGYRIPDEHTGGDYRNHFSGSLAMAKSPEPNSGGSQFYLNHMPTPWLNGKHTVFGYTVQGLDVVRQLEEGDAVQSAVVLRKRDHEYEPQTLDPTDTTTTPKPPTPNP